MPFRHKGSPNWHYDFQIGGRRFHGSCGTADFQEAKAVEAATRVAARASAPVKGTFTLSQVLGTYYTDVAEHQPSAATTFSQTKTILSVLTPTMKLADLTMAEAQRYVTVQRATMANATVNRHLSLLARAIKHMVAVHAAAAPDLDLRRLHTPEPEERVRELTRDEQDALFKTLRPDLHPFVALALMTGLRRAELAALQWRHVDFDAATIRVRQKGGKSRTLPMNGELRAFLSSLPRANSLPSARHVLTFVDQATSERRLITPGGSVMVDFREAVTAAGIEDFRFHDLRHTFATRLLRQTQNLKLVCKLMGHRNVSTTMRYAHVLQDDMRLALDGYSALSRPNPRTDQDSTAQSTA
jgi:integrase